MSLPPNSTVCLLQATGNGFSRESFQKFFESWLIEQDQRLQDLISASESYKLQNQSEGDDVGGRETEIHNLINRVIHHYEHYYNAKSRWAKEDILSMLSPSWKSTLEDAFLWIGGWRPSMAFHLLYSKTGIQFEAALSDLIHGIGMGDMGDLSPRQLRLLDEMHRKTIGEEKEMTEKMAKQQETVADTSMVELSHEVGEMRREERGRSEIGDQERVERTMEGQLEEILQIADGMRMRTLKAVIEILTPIQAVHFLIAAAELHQRLHEWGKKRDANHDAEPSSITVGS